MGTERRRVAAFSLLFTYLFFLEYLPPLSRVHLPFDIEGYHYPLLDYAFQTLQQGHFPEWDPGIYCGISFVGNIQAALFYPPNWLLFAVNLGQPRLVYKTLEALVLAHVWLAFLLCYIWLRGRRLRAMASALGAGVFAYSGYMLSQIQHMGVVTAYAWIPLGLLGIDQAVEQRCWRPLWKLAAASALWFLAGYPPAWFALAVCAIAYAASTARGWKVIGGTCGALAAGLVVSMIQLLPALEAAALKVPDVRYGSASPQAKFYLSYFLPNYFNPLRDMASELEPTAEYFYVGAPALLALAWVLSRRFRGQLPAVVMAGVSALWLTNPLGIVEAVLRKSPMAPEFLREWNFFAGLTVAAALLTASALDQFLQAPSTRALALSTPGMIGLLALWSVRQIWVWLPGGAQFGAGWRAAFEPLVMLTLLTVGLHLLRFEQGRRRTVLAATLLLAVGIDYKVFGTDKSFNAHRGGFDEFHDRAETPGFDDIVRRLRAAPEFRVAVDETALFATDLRHIGLASPQGFDPLLPQQFKKTIEASTPFATDRTFDLDPAKEPLLQPLGVRYFWTRQDAAAYAAVSGNPNFHAITGPQDYFQVFELRQARPAYQWDGKAQVLTWTAARREFRVQSPGGGRFALVEQFSPGWRALVDGGSVRPERWNGAFQAIEVAPGEHRVEFVYRSAGLRWGAAITVVSLLAFWILARGRPGPAAASPALRSR